MKIYFQSILYFFVFRYEKFTACHMCDPEGLLAPTKATHKAIRDPAG